jgi:hypothetical protein
MKNITGPPVVGDDFFNRESELSRLRQAVEDGNHVLISAPRRVGKSSLVLQLCQILKKEGWTVVQLDVEDTPDEVGFVKALLQAARDAGIDLPLGIQIEQRIQRIRDSLKGFKAEAAGVGIGVGDGEGAVWDDVANDLKSVFREAGKKGRVLVAVDEVPVFLAKLSNAPDGPRRASEFLYWLRALRQAGGNKVTWTLSGSIGLDSFVERRGLQGTVGDLQIQTLGAYSGEVAVACLKKLGSNPRYRLNMPEPVCRDIIARVGWPLPYYLQLLFHGLLQRPPERLKAPDFPTESDVADAYEDLLQPHHSPYFSHWDSRLDRQFDDPADAGIARYLLNHVCQDARGRPRQKLFDLLVARQPHADPDVLDRRLRGILDLLERDGYFLRSGDAYAFRSFLLRDYWKRRYA